jgi:hypothetical protein
MVKKYIKKGGNFPPNIPIGHLNTLRRLPGLNAEIRENITNLTNILNSPDYLQSFANSNDERNIESLISRFVREINEIELLLRQYKKAYNIHTDEMLRNYSLVYNEFYPQFLNTRDVLDHLIGLFNEIVSHPVYTEGFKKRRRTGGAKHPSENRGRREQPLVNVREIEQQTQINQELLVSSTFELLEHLSSQISDWNERIDLNDDVDHWENFNINNYDEFSQFIAFTSNELMVGSQVLVNIINLTSREELSNYFTFVYESLSELVDKWNEININWN